MALELIKISEFPQVNTPEDWIVVTDTTGIAHKISKEDFKAWLGTVTVTAPKPINPTDPAPTLDGVYIPEIDGTYTNLGGIIVDRSEGGADYGKSVDLIKNGATWVKVTEPLPQAENKIPDWVPGTYLEGDQRIHNGQIWSVREGIVSTTEEPGIGTDWVGEIDKINESYLLNYAKQSDLGFTVLSKNKFDYNDPSIQRGKYITGDGPIPGSISDNISYSVSGLIPIKAGETLICNKVLPSNTSIGHNLYDSTGTRISTVNNTNAVTATVDGFAQFTIRVNSTEDISLANVQIESGTEVTDYVPFGRYVKGESIIDGSINTSKLAKRPKEVVESFVEKIYYDEITPLITASNKAPFPALDISGWGAQYNKTNISFNAIRIPAGIPLNPAVSDLRKVKYAQVCIKNAYTDTDFIAKSSVIDIGGIDPLPEMIFPLMEPDLTNFKTLSDASFTGTSYWINVYHYNADMSFAYVGRIQGVMSNYVVGTSRYVTTNSITSWNNLTSNPSLAFEHLLLSNVRIGQHLIELDNLEEKVDAIPQEVIEISLPDKIHAVVGDTLQLFWRGIIKAVNPYNYDIVVNCTKGAWFPRYFEYTPALGDVGTTTFEVKVKNSNGVVLANKTCSLITRNAVKEPSVLTKVLNFGDSLTNNPTWTNELARRLTGTGGAPIGKGFNNIQFVGRKKSEGGLVGREGNSGWSWADYLTTGRRAFTFTITIPTIAPTVDAVYSDANGKMYTMWWDYSTTSVKMLVNDMVSTPPTSGVLTKVSGTGDATLTFSSRLQSSGNPFWNDTTGSLDFTGYINKWAGGAVDVVYCLLTWNAQYGNRADFSSFTNHAKNLFSHMKSEFPNIKIKLMGVQVPDLKGGVRVNGSPKEDTYTDTYGLVVTALNMNKAYQDLANDPIYSDFVEFINISSQVDSEYNMPFVEKQVNTRNGDFTEPIGTNDVHPNENGYLQIGDVVFRNFVANYCQ